MYKTGDHMRRKDRERTLEFGLGVIDEAGHGTLSVLDGSDIPYAVPLSIARKGMQLFFHTAKSGTKNDLLTDGTKVRIVFVGQNKVPDILSEEEITDAVHAGKASSLFTTLFRSAIVTGTVNEVVDEDEKQDALRLIAQKYTPAYMPHFAAAFESGAALTAVFCIQIESVTAKEKS